MSGDIKLQINSLEALERLIGGDSKLEMEIRNNIVQEFTKKYLKSLVYGCLDKASKQMDGYYKSALEVFVNNIKDKDILKNGTGLRLYELSDKHKMLISDLIRDHIEESIKEYIKTFDYKRSIKDMIEKQILTIYQEVKREMMTILMKGTQ